MDVITDDIILWKKFREGNKDSLASLFVKYYPDLIRYGFKIYADEEALKDNIQQLFVDIWLQKTPPPVGSVKAYLIMALKYKLLKTIARQQKIRTHENSQEHSFEISHESFLITSEDEKEKVQQLIAAIKLLPNRQREIIYLKYYMNLSYEEICEVMDIQYQVARNQISQAIKAMKKVVGTSMLYWLLYQ